MNLFGKKKNPTQSSAGTASASSSADTIMRLRKHLDTMEKREKFLEKRAEQQLVEAKRKLHNKDKNGATFCLKRKKMYENELQKLSGARTNIERQIMALEAQTFNKETFDAMRAGKNAMSATRGRMDIDNVDDVLDDIKEEMEQAEQISDAMARPIDDVFDDDELLAELNELEELDAAEQMLDVPAEAPVAASTNASTVNAEGDRAFTMPEAPKTPPPATATSVEVEGDVNDDEMRALRELEASMAAI